ncbi:MAG TPA: META domain-containing protein [Pyrinomonadaceae bacterium]
MSHEIKQKNFRSMVLLTILLVSSASLCAQTNGPRVRTDAGSLEGTRSGDIPITLQNPPVDLGGTSWQLVKFQGSNDSTLTPDDRSKYTIALGTDGRVTARIDCNRGRGTWKSSGPNQIQFGPLALTRAMCPPGSLHDQIAKHWNLVRSYIIKDGHLFLSLMADGGIYEFEPITSPASLIGKKWKLTEVNGAAVQSPKAYIEFDGKTKRFSGNGGCNRIAGGYKVDAMHIKFSQAISTRMACIDSEVQRVETDFLKALNEVTDFQIQGEVLRFTEGDQPKLTFRADSTAVNGTSRNSPSVLPRNNAR